MKVDQAASRESFARKDGASLAIIDQYGYVSQRLAMAEAKLEVAQMDGVPEQVRLDIITDAMSKVYDAQRSLRHPGGSDYRTALHDEVIDIVDSAVLPNIEAATATLTAQRDVSFRIVGPGG